MPKVPRLQLQERGVQAPPTVQIPNFAAGFADALGKVGQAMFDIDKNLKEAQDAAIFGEKKTKYLEQAKDLELQMNTIGDPNKIQPAFQAGLQAIEEGLMADIEPSRALKADLTGFFNTERGIRVPKIKQVEFDLRLGKTRASGNKTLRSLERAVALAATPAEEEQARGELQEYFRVMSEFNVKSPVELDKEAKGFERNVDFHRAINILRESPSKLMQNIEEGVYKNLTIQDQDRLIAQAVNAQEKLDNDEERRLREQQDKNAGLLFQKFMRGELTQDLLDLGLRTNKLDPDDFESLTNALNSQIKGGGPSQPDIFNDYFGKIIEGTVNEKQIRAAEVSEAEKIELMRFFTEVKTKNAKLTPGRPSAFREGWAQVRNSIVSDFAETFTQEQANKTARAQRLYGELTRGLDPGDREAHIAIADQLREQFGTEVTTRPLSQQEKPMFESPALTQAAFDNKIISRRVWIQQTQLWAERARAIERQETTRDQEPKKKKKGGFRFFSGEER